MKKYGIMLLIALFTCSFAVMAQQPQRQGQGQRPGQGQQMSAKERAKTMAKQLDLTEEQTAQVQKLYEERDEARKNVQRDASESREVRRERFEKERKAFDEKLEKIIGKEKMEKLQKIREEQRQNRPQRNNN